ncbi:MAG: ATP-binding protein [Verrucomicrobiota bacterium]
MIHILFITSKEGIPESLKEAFSAPEIRVVTRHQPDEATSAIERNAFNLSIIYETGNVSNLRRQIRDLRKLNSRLSILVISQQYSVEAEQITFEEGGELYLTEPLPLRSLERIIQQHTRQEPAVTEQTHYTGYPTRDEPINSAPVPALQILRDFSHILRFSLDYKAFTHHFVLKLRDYISFSRIGIFLETQDTPAISSQRPSRTLACIASFGLPSDLIDCFQLSREVGIGKSLTEQPRIVHAADPNQRGSIAVNDGITKEFAILGCHIAIPINDRERCIGAAVINGPVTGRSYSEDELQLLYLLMEELGLAIRNSRLHSGLAAHGKLISNVLESMSSGALVLSENLEVIYTNDSAKRYLQEEVNNDRIEWADLPSTLATPVHRAVEKGELLDPFIIPGIQSESLYRISIIPFSVTDEVALLPRPVMVVIEDFTHIEASKKTAVENTRAELISLIAERFAHEIRNSLVPLTTHMQLIDRKIEQPKFQTSLKNALMKETGRIKRFSDQMLYLAQNSNPISESVDLRESIENAFDKAKSLANCKTAKLELSSQIDCPTIEGNAEAITYALEEIFLNSFQAQENALKKIFVTLQQNDEGILSLKISDTGPGFEERALISATDPFFTTRNTGVGLGLSVADKIISEHKGYITIATRKSNNDYDLKIEIPLSN